MWYLIVSIPDLCNLITLKHRLICYQLVLEFCAAKQKTSAGFKALKGLDVFVNGVRGCSHSTYMKLYDLLVLPSLGYGSSVTVEAITECSKEFNKVQSSVMLKATRCVSSTSTNSHKHITNGLRFKVETGSRSGKNCCKT